MANIFRHLGRLRLPDEHIARNRRYFKTFDNSHPLSEYSFVVLDTELTGLDKRKDEIISIGAVRVRDMQIDLGGSFHYYVRPKRLDHTKATLVHKITPEQLKKSPSLAEVLPRVLSFIGNDVIVGHYIGLDMEFINRAMRKLLGGVIANPCLDTMRLAQIYRRIVLGYYHENNLNSGARYNLQNLTTEFGLPYFEAHDALEDALQTAYLFLFLVKQVQKAGLVTLADVQKAARGVNWASM